MSVLDPLRTVWDALDRTGSGPRGPEHKFIARCPAHDDRNASLSISQGEDGRALIHCHAGCDPERILGALGLGWPDLFPAGHIRARRWPLAQARHSDFTGNARTAANALLALDRLGERWEITITTRCPYCESPNAQLVVSRDHEPYLHCQGACTARMFAGALAGRIHDRQEGA